MKKVFKIIGILLSSLIGISIIALLIIGPSDPIILTEEEQAQQNKQQTELFSNIDLSGFETVSISGKKVTSHIFDDYKVTMINLWVTNCSSCISEMPEIAKLYNDKPEGTNIMSICVDTVDDKKAVDFSTEVMTDSKANFLTLIPDNVIQNELTNDVTIFPTTIFVDSTGKTIGTPHFGGTSADDYRQAILERLELIDSTN